MARGRSPMCRSSTPSIVRRRSRGSLPRLHLLDEPSQGHLFIRRDLPLLRRQIRATARATGLSSPLFFAFLPGIGSNISPCPAIRFHPFFEGTVDRFSSAILRRRASMRFTTFCGRPAACARRVSLPRFSRRVSYISRLGAWSRHPLNLPTKWLPPGSGVGPPPQFDRWCSAKSGDRLQACSASATCSNGGGSSRIPW